MRSARWLRRFTGWSASRSPHCDQQHVLRYPRQATFHPLKYLEGLAGVIEAKGGVFYSDTIVQEIEERKDGSVAAKTDSGVITVKAAVVATNSPIVDTLALQEVYEPTRKTPSGIGNFIRENLTAVQNFAEYLAPGELKSFDDLRPGQGAIVRQGLTKIAAYRDKDGTRHGRSAACTHIGCHLHWNSFETCWDCPCHGSQFAVDGTALNAPAVSALADVKAGD
jgi:Rieske Fe-S protein